MSLNQKYTWGAFLKEHPDLKKKGVKRTSAEGRKAFESAYKTKIKEYLSARAEKVNTLKKKATAKFDDLTKTIKKLQKEKEFSKARIYQEKAGRQDALIARLTKETSRIKTLQKSI
jgi:hypothetical protein